MRYGGKFVIRSILVHFKSVVFASQMLTRREPSGHEGGVAFVELLRAVMQKYLISSLLIALYPHVDYHNSSVVKLAI
jgi:hypothetical protein